MADAQSSRGPDTGPSLVHSIELDVPAPRVWQMICDPEFTREYFFGYAVRSPFTTGAAIVFEDDEGRPQITGRILTLEVGRRLIISARILRDADTQADAPSRISWEIIPLGPTKSRLVVTHDDFSGESPTYHIVANGWPLVMAGFKELAETGRATRAQALWQQKPAAGG